MRSSNFVELVPLISIYSGFAQFQLARSKVKFTRPTYLRIAIPLLVIIQEQKMAQIQILRNVSCCGKK